MIDRLRFACQIASSGFIVGLISLYFSSVPNDVHAICHELKIITVYYMIQVQMTEIQCLLMLRSERQIFG